jgi:hypothetical protein
MSHRVWATAPRVFGHMVPNSGGSVRHVIVAIHRKGCPPLATPGASHPQDPPDRDSGVTSERISALISNPLPRDALTVNVAGRKVTGPDDGFGKLWRKHYWVRLNGSAVTPVELIEVWKERYTEFWPKGSHLYQPPGGLEEGDVAAADLAMIGGTRVGTGIIVIEETDTSFTFATLEGHTFAGTISFSGRDDAGVTLANVEVIMRASDPLYELGMPLGGHRHENRFWKASLVALAKSFGVEAEPDMVMECLDPRRKWRNATNIVHNAFLHTITYLVARPFRRLAGGQGSRGRST